MAFSNVHYVSIYQTVTSLTYVFVLLAFRPLYEEMAKEGAALDNIQIIDVSPEESRLYQEAYEAEFQMQLDLITDRYNRLQKIKLVSDSDREPTA